MSGKIYVVTSIDKQSDALERGDLIESYFSIESAIYGIVRYLAHCQPSAQVGLLSIRSQIINFESPSGWCLH